jgi:ribosomal protein S18 acetylase RimI-like enzyme
MAVQPQSLISENRDLVIRRATAADADASGKICYEAFRTLATKHSFPSDFPSAEMPVHVLSMMFSSPSFFCVVAEQNGKIVGSNCLYERGAMGGVGPITIDPAAQNKNVGRQLMQAVMTRAEERRCAGVRLVQAGYHMRSLSLYAKLGFVVRETLACMQGSIGRAPQGYSIRPARSSDLGACNEICLRIHGHDRSGELEDGIQQGTAVVAESEGRIKAYAASLAFYGHAVGEGNEDLQALLSAASEFAGPGILVPTRNAGLFRWCLEQGLRVVQPMTLMTMGLYNEPSGAYLPSILF